jgi:hypothetical protein
VDAFFPILSARYRKYETIYEVDKPPYVDLLRSLMLIAVLDWIARDMDNMKRASRYISSMGRLEAFQPA